MALINCPNCSKQISDKAIRCPHCGFTQRIINQKMDFSDIKLTKWENILWYALMVAVCMLLIVRIYMVRQFFVDESPSPFIGYLSLFIPLIIMLLLITPIKKKSLRIIGYSLWGVYSAVDIVLYLVDIRVIDFSIIIALPFELITLISLIAYILLLIILAYSYKSFLFTLISILFIINRMNLVSIVCGVLGFYEHRLTIVVLYTIVIYALLLYLPKTVWKKMSRGEVSLIHNKFTTVSK